MKTPTPALLILALACAALVGASVTTASAADTPAVLRADFKSRAAPALEKLNATLTKQAAAIATQLISKGDAASAEDVTTQVKAKIANEPVDSPHPATALLFAQYDSARLAAMKPVQASFYTRIDTALKAAGNDLALIDELGKIRTEIEDAGGISAATSPAIAIATTTSGSTTTAPSSITGSTTTAPVGNTRLFIGKSWYTRAGSEYHFNKDGTGYRVQKMDFDGPVAFTWTQRPDEIVEILWRKQPTAQPSKSWFRFDDKKTAFQGDRESSITAPLEMR